MASNAPIEIFRAGRHTAKDGKQYDFPAADLAAACAAYDAAAEPAPLVVGHPRLDGPAYGWVAGLSMVGDTVMADPEKLEPAFAEMVNAGRFRRISTSWYLKDDPRNPRPGTLYPKHIGFLGAAAPAVRGLKPVHFSAEQDSAAVTIDLDLQETDMPDTDRTAEFAERETALETREAQFAEREASFGEREAGLAARETAATEREATAIAEARMAVHGNNVDFAEAQVAAGKLAPAGRALVVGLLDGLAELPANADFGEEAGELTPTDAFRRLFDGARPVVDFGEHAADDGRRETGETPEAIAERAIEFAETERGAGRDITIQAAVRRVMQSDG